MPSKDWRFRIRHILESVAAIENYVADMTFEEFVQDQRTVDAVVRRFTSHTIQVVVSANSG